MFEGLVDSIAWWKGQHSRWGEQPELDGSDMRHYISGLVCSSFHPHLQDDSTAGEEGILGELPSHYGMRSRAILIWLREKENINLLQLNISNTGADTISIYPHQNASCSCTARSQRKGSINECLIIIEQPRVSAEYDKLLLLYKYDGILGEYKSFAVCKQLVHDDNFFTASLLVS